MKMLTALFVLCSVFQASANTKNFIYDGTQSSVELLLNSQKNKIDGYRMEDRPGICSEKREVGTKQDCKSDSKKFPDGTTSVNIVCGPTPVYEYFNVPCIKKEKVAVEVKEYDVEAKVTLNISNLSQEAVQGEEIRVDLKGDVISLQVGKTSKKFLIVQKNQSILESKEESLKSIEAEYNLELVAADPILQALKGSSAQVQNSVLSFNLGEAAPAEIFEFAVKVVKKKKFFGSDTTLIDRSLLKSEVSISNTGVASVNLAQLGANTNSGSFEIATQRTVKLGGIILNPKSFPVLSSSQNISIKN